MQYNFDKNTSIAYVHKLFHDKHIDQQFMYILVNWFSTTTCKYLHTRLMPNFYIHVICDFCSDFLEKNQIKKHKSISR